MKTFEFSDNLAMLEAPKSQVQAPAPSQTKTEQCSGERKKVTYECSYVFQRVERRSAERSLPATYILFCKIALQI